MDKFARLFYSQENNFVNMSPIPKFSQIQAQERFSALPRPPGLRLPLTDIKIQAAPGVENQPFGLETADLFLPAASRPQRDSAPGVDDAMPGKPLFFRAGVKGPDHLAGTPGVAGQGGDLTVGGHPSPGNGADEGDHLTDERVIPAFHFLVDVPANTIPPFYPARQFFRKKAGGNPRELKISKEGL
jgi:hypothetical protein